MSVLAEILPVVADLFPPLALTLQDAAAAGEGGRELVPDEVTDIVGLTLAIGALGTAAFGLVDSLKNVRLPLHLKWSPPFLGVGSRFWGFGRIEEELKQIAPVLNCAYGKDWKAMIAEQYANGRSQGDARETIRQGVRVGLGLVAIDSESTAKSSSHVLATLADYIGGFSADDMSKLSQSLRSSEPWSPKTEAMMARFELALDLKLRGAFFAADRIYGSSARLLAMVSALVLSVVAFYIVAEPASVTAFAQSGDLALAMLVGLVAVPLAPISKDIATAISAAVRAARASRGG